MLWIKSLATIDLFPASATEPAPALQCNTEAVIADSVGLSVTARTAATIPVSTSPLPAVASAGLVQRKSPIGSPIDATKLPAPFRIAVHWSDWVEVADRRDPVSLDFLRRHIEQVPSLTRMRRNDAAGRQLAFA